MIRIRRAAVLLTTAAAVLLGSALPAGARFSQAETLPTMAVASVDVTAPTNVNFKGTSCDSYWNGYRWVTTLHAKVNWRASTTPVGVSGYRVVARVNGYPYPIAEVPASVTSLRGDYDASIIANNSITVTVTTLTSYGWTEESEPSGVITC